jgi:cellulose biosynthesis protein BcsQ
VGKVNLIIGDSDEAYLESLSSFLICNYSHRFNVSSFSKHECLEKFINETEEKIDILLLNEELSFSLVNTKHADCLIILTEKSENSTRNAVNKYQQGDQLVGSILNIFSEKSNSGITYKGMGKKTRVVSIYSPQGGSGKTCIALSTCIQCARKGLKVFYLNLEDFNSTSAFFDCSSKTNFSNIIYYLKEKNKNLSLKVESLKSIDPVWGIHYFSPSESDTEINEMTFEDLKELIDKIVCLEFYDFIFIDMSYDFGEKNINLLIHSDRIVLTLAHGLCSEVKLHRFVKTFALIMDKQSPEYRDKLNIVFNKYKQGMETCFEDLFFSNDYIKVPEIQNFDFTKIFNAVKMDSNYVEAIDNLIKRYIDIH